MAEEGFKRKLTAILSADVVGYSRLMEDNEEATIQSINAYPSEFQRYCSGRSTKPARKGFRSI